MIRPVQVELEQMRAAWRHRDWRWILLTLLLWWVVICLAWAAATFLALAITAAFA